MPFSPSILKMGALASLALLAVACSSPDESVTSASMPSPVDKSMPLPLDPAPIAKLSLPNGNTLEFQDFDSDVMVMETGKAGTTPFLDGNRSPEALAKLGATPEERLAGIWKLAAPGVQMPQSLKEIQARWKNRPSVSMSRERLATLPEVFGESLGRGRVETLSKVAAPVGCNNGCCDYQWLSTLSDCKKIWDYNWFHYNYGWSRVNSTGIDIWSGLVCAATGNSTWKVNISDGKGGSWTVQQGYYKTYWWIAGWFDKDATSSVNSSANQALHAYCGNVSY